jgi:hypothetical protein
MIAETTADTTNPVRPAAKKASRLPNIIDDMAMVNAVRLEILPDASGLYGRSLISVSISK